MVRMLALVPIVFAAVVLLDASEAKAFRCHDRVVSVGDALGEVRARCGEPTTGVERDVVHHEVVMGYDGSTFVRSWTVRVAHWVYDFGPSRLMRELHFENGRLLSIRTLGRGGVHDGIGPMGLPEPPPSQERAWVTIRRD